MTTRLPSTLLPILWLAGLLLAWGPRTTWAQFGDDPFGEPPRVQRVEDDLFGAPAEAPAKVEDKQPDEKPDAEKDDPDDVGEPAEPAGAVPLSPREVRLHLMDGSVISGELTVDEITLTTEFGELVIPIARIRSFRPGLDSYPQIAERIDSLFDDLASDDYQSRENAHKALVKMGVKIYRELKRFEKGDNAEQNRHVQEILKEVEKLIEEQREFGAEDRVEPYIREDTVETTLFTALGSISPQTFTIASKYGPLTVQLADIRLADRPTGKKEPIRRSFTVNGTNLVQLGLKNTSIRVEKGDKITITAEGQMVMTPWGSNAMVTPDGAGNYGWYLPNKIPIGALVARIGSSGEVMKIGSKYSGVAKRNGVLHFGVAMQAQYAQQGYSYPGQYEVKVKIEPQ